MTNDELRHDYVLAAMTGLRAADPDNAWAPEKLAVAALADADAMMALTSKPEDKDAEIERLQGQAATTEKENATYSHFMSTLITQFAIQDPEAAFDTIFGVFAKALGGQPHA